MSILLICLNFVFIRTRANEEKSWHDQNAAQCILSKEAGFIDFIQGIDHEA